MDRRQTTQGNKKQRHQAEPDGDVTQPASFMPGLCSWLCPPLVILALFSPKHWLICCQISVTSSIIDKSFGQATNVVNHTSNIWRKIHYLTIQASPAQTSNLWFDSYCSQGECDITNWNLAMLQCTLLNSWNFQMNYINFTVIVF